MNQPLIVAKDIVKIFSVNIDQPNIYNETPISFLKKELRSKKSKEKGYWALKGVSFDIHSGESVGIIGSNGSGKSTLLRILTGITQPTYGEVSISDNFGELLSLDTGLIPNLTGIQNIYLYASMKGIPRNEIKKLIPQILEFSELGGFAEQPIKIYSTGMRGRLAFSIVLNTIPNVILIDEALSAGDQSFQQKCIQKFHGFVKHPDHTLVVVSHALSLLQQLCTRILWIEKGLLKMDGPPEQVIKEYQEFFQ